MILALMKKAVVFGFLGLGFDGGPVRDSGGKLCAYGGFQGPHRG